VITGLLFICLPAVLQLLVKVSTTGNIQMASIVKLVVAETNKRSTDERVSLPTRSRITGIGGMTRMIPYLKPFDRPSEGDTQLEVYRGHENHVPILTHFHPYR
jgi:hypothetical protein